MTHKGKSQKNTSQKNPPLVPRYMPLMFADYF